MLILAIEPDKRQASQIKAIAHSRLGAELVLADSADGALKALGDRVPDLILTTALLSPRDEATLNDRLRTLERAAQFVQTLTIPMLAAPAARKRAGGVLSVLRREKPKQVIAEGCDPAVFADQIKEYLERAATERENHAAALAEAAERAGARELSVAEFHEAPADAFEPAAAAPEFAAKPQPEPSVWSERQDPAATDPRVQEPPSAAILVSPAEDEEPFVAAPASVILLPEAEPEVPVTPEPRAVVIHAEFPSPQSQSSRPSWTAQESVSAEADDEAPSGDEVVIELTPQVSAEVVEPVVLHEPATAPEPSMSKEEDLEIFDLDLDALIDDVQGDDAKSEAASAQPAGEVEEAGSLDIDDLGADDTDLQVYDLDLSALLPQPPASDSTDVGDSADEGIPLAAGSTGSVEIEGDEKPVQVAPVSQSAASHRDDDVEVYDLDMDFDLLVNQTEESSAPKASSSSASSPRTEAKPDQVQVEPAPPVRTVAMGTVIESRPIEDIRPRAASTAPRALAPDEEEPTQREIDEDDSRVIKSGVWAPLTTGAHRLWPRLEGGVAQHAAPRLAVVGPAEAPVVAVLPPLAPTAPKRPEWLNAIKALRRDSQRHQADNEPSAIALDDPSPLVAQPQAPARQESAPPVAPKAPPPPDEYAPTPEAAQTAKSPSRSKKRRMARKAKKASRAEKPVQNDWGFFDPEEGGLSSLVTKLDEITVPK